MKIQNGSQKSEAKGQRAVQSVPKTFKTERSQFTHCVMFSNGKEIGQGVWSNGLWHGALDIKPYWQTSVRTKDEVIRWLLFVAPEKAVVQEIHFLHTAVEGGAQ